MNRFWAISAAGFAWIAAATAVQPPQPGMYPDHFFPEISVVCWTAVCLSVALAGRARAVDRNWRSSAGLRWAFGAAALLLVPAALGWSSFGLGPLGASLLLASAAFHRASLGILVVGLFALLTAGSIEAALSVLSQSDWAARNPLVSELAFKLHARGRAAILS